MCKIRSFRERKLTSRLDLHREMQVEAYYMTNPTSDPILVRVRIWSKWAALGNPANATTDGYAERAEMIPKILFMRSEVEAPLENSIVSVAQGEAYRILSREAPDGISVTCSVSTLLPTDPLLTTLPYPK